MKIKKFTKCLLTMAVGAVLSTTLTGCGSTDYLTQQKKANAIGDQITQVHKEQSSDFINHPPVDLSASLPLVHKTTWVDSFTVTLHAKEAPLSSVIHDISSSTGLSFVWGDKSKKDQLITINKKKATLSDVFSALEAKTGYQIDTSNRDAISINAIITESFPLMKFAGKNNFMIGKKSGASLSGDSDSSETGGIFTSDQDQFTNIEGSSIDPLKGLLPMLQNVGGNSTMITVNEALGLVTVTGKPLNVHRVSAFITDFNRELGRMVRVDAKIVVFTSKNANSFNVNLDLIKKATDGVLQFTTTASSSAVSGLENLSTFHAVSTNGSMSGTSLFIKALRKQGVVSVSTEPSLTVLNNQMGEIQSVHKEAYAKNIGVNAITSSGNNNSGGDGALASIEQGVVVAGFSMRSLVKVVQDQIMLQMSGTVSEMGDFGTVSYGGTQLKTPQIDENSFNQSARLIDGQTLILTGYDQDSAKSGHHDSFHNQYLGGNGGKEQHTETMVLLTAHLI